MTLNYNFSGIRLQDGMLTPVDWAFEVDLVALGKKNSNPEDIELLEEKATVAYQKIYFWLDTNLPNILAVNVNDRTDIYIANLLANVMLYSPATPSDDILVQLLHAKISSLVEQDLLVGQMRLKGSDTALQYTYDCGDEGYLLPSATSEYFPEIEVRDSVPWWFRDDGFCVEFIKPPENPDDEDPYSYVVDPMDEFYRIIQELSDQGTAIKEPAKILQVEKWKPKKI